MQTLFKRIFGHIGPTEAVNTHTVEHSTGRFPTVLHHAGGGPRFKPDPEWLLADEVTPETLLSVFRQAYMDVETIPNGMLRVSVEGAGHVNVRVDVERKLLVFVQHYGLKAESTRSDKLELANRINDRVVLVRLTVADDTTLTSDHFMAYDGVVTPRQIIEGLRRFAHVTRAAVSRMDTEDVVQ